MTIDLLYYIIKYSGNCTGTAKDMNSCVQYCRSCIHILQPANEIRSAVLVMHGDKAHSFCFGKDAYENMIKGSKYAGNKQLLVIEGASHTDLYDGGEKKVIPFDKPEDFCNKYLK